MANKIILKKTSTASKVPLSTDLEVGEIAVNLADQKLYSKNAGGTVIVVGQGIGGSGDVVGGASSTDNALARYDGTTGKLIQNSTAILDDSGNLDTASIKTDYADLDTGASAPTYAQGRTFWDSGNGTSSTYLNPDVTLQNGQEIVTLVYNGTGSTITNGSVVAVAGAQGQRPSVVLADADSEPTSASTLGIATQDIANGAEGFVTSFGFIRGVNTSGFTAGSPIYLSQTAGGFTATRPSAPAHTVILGWVIKVNASSGEIFVHINNGWELDELHNVLITSPTSGNTLIYDASVGVWENANITGGTGLSVTNGAGTIALANTGVTSAVAGTGISVSGATGAVTVTNSDRGSSQNIFKNIAVSGQSTVVADSNDDTVTLANGTGISITTNATTDTITVTNTAPDQTVSLTGAGATSISGTYPNFTISSVNTTYSQATSTTLGLIELGSDTVQAVAPNAVTATANRSYALQLNSAGQAMVNVPWTDTNSGGTVTSVSGTGTVNGLTLSGSVTTSGSLTLGGAISGVPNSATTATSANTANAIVARDASGNFSAGTITATLNGNASTASSTANPTFSGDAVAKDNITTRTDSGFYESSTGTTAEGWPVNDGAWQQMIACTHSNDSNYYSMQIGGSFFDNVFYGRKTNGSGTTGWVQFLTSGNYTSYSPTLTGTGASGTWGISVTGNAETATTASGVSAGVVTGRMIYDSFTATAGQTVFTTSQTYTANKIEVFLNGVKMVNGAGNDVTVNGGTTVTMLFAVSAGTRVDLVYPI